MKRAQIRAMEHALFAAREVAQETVMRNRVIEADGWTPTWPAEATRWVDRIRQTYQTLDEGGGRPVQSRVRDPWGREIVKCDPTCTYGACVAARKTMQAIGFTVDRMHCSGCLECTLMEDA